MLLINKSAWSTVLLTSTIQFDLLILETDHDKRQETQLKSLNMAPGYETWSCWAEWRCERSVCELFLAWTFVCSIKQATPNSP